MVRVHPHVAIATPMFEATAVIELQLGQDAFGASRPGLAVLPSHVGMNLLAMWMLMISLSEARRR